MDNKVLLQAIALDLKRAALGFHGHSAAMADRFYQEVLKRKSQLDSTHLPEHVTRLLETMEERFKNTNEQRRAEDALMYSNLFLSFAKNM